MRLALVAHDQMKDEIIGLVHKYKEFFARQELVATATTGGLIAAKTGFKVERVLSGPQGGDVQIASQVACGTVQAVIFLRDPLTAQPHEPDITALLRICDVHNIPLATNLGSAEHLLQSLSL